MSEEVKSRDAIFLLDKEGGKERKKTQNLILGTTKMDFDGSCQNPPNQNKMYSIKIVADNVNIFPPFKMDSAEASAFGALIKTGVELQVLISSVSEINDIGKSDLEYFCSISIHSKTIKSKAKQASKGMVEWAEHLRLQINNQCTPYDELRVELCEKGASRDEVIAWCTLQVVDTFRQKVKELVLDHPETLPQTPKILV